MLFWYIFFTGTPPSTEKPAGEYPTLVEQPGGKIVPVVQAYAFTKYLGYLALTFDDLVTFFRPIFFTMVLFELKAFISGGVNLLEWISHSPWRLLSRRWYRMKQVKKFSKKYWFPDPMVLEALKPWKSEIQNLCNVYSTVTYSGNSMFYSFCTFSKHSDRRDQSSSIPVPYSREQSRKFYHWLNGWMGKLVDFDHSSFRFWLQFLHFQLQVCQSSEIWSRVTHFINSWIN